MADIRVEGPHVAGCWAADTPSAHCCDAEFLFLDRAGTQRGQTTRWLRMRCNNTRCTHSVLVRVDAIGALIDERLEAGGG